MIIGLPFERKKVYKMKERVRNKLMSGHSEWFKLLKKYYVLVWRANLGLTAIVCVVGEDPQFLRMFVCFAV